MINERDTSLISRGVITTLPTIPSPEHLELGSLCPAKRLGLDSDFCIPP